MKDELRGKIMTEFAALRPKTYYYLIDDGTSDKKAKETKKCWIKQIPKLNDYKNCLLNNEIILKSQQRFKREARNVYTEKKKIALSSNDDKILQTFGRITSYPYDTSVELVCKTKLLSLYKIINYDDLTNENKTKHNPKWPYIPDHPYRILIIRASGPEKTNALLNLTNNLPDNDTIYLYAKDLIKQNINI